MWKFGRKIHYSSKVMMTWLKYFPIEMHHISDFWVESEANLMHFYGKIFQSGHHNFWTIMNFSTKFSHILVKSIIKVSRLVPCPYLPWHPPADFLKNPFILDFFNICENFVEKFIIVQKLWWPDSNIFQ